VRFERVTVTMCLQSIPSHCIRCSIEPSAMYYTSLGATSKVGVAR
jgi:hypothetical protein